MNNFKPGDRVAICNGPTGAEYTCTGILVSLDGNWAVELESDVGDGHDCGGRVKSNKGWWVHPSHIRLVPPFEQSVRAYIKSELTP